MPTGIYNDVYGDYDDDDDDDDYNDYDDINDDNGEIYKCTASSKINIESNNFRAEKNTFLY